MRFTSKGEARQCMPVTEEIRRILEPLDHATSIPYVWQLRIREHYRGREICVYDLKSLRREFTAACKSLGYKRMVPHDLRRTAAVAMLEQTHDIRTVQALLGHTDLKTTLWYLDHDSVKVDRETLERMKRPFVVHRKEETA